MRPLHEWRDLVRPQICVLLTFLGMLLVSWRRWTGMIVDFGRETDLPLRLLDGEVLYRDIHYMYGPFSPYFNAFLYRMFGVGLDTLTISGISVSALIALLVYRISRRLLSPTHASITTSLVIVLCLFRPAGNMVLPYSFGAAHALVFSLATVLFTLRYFEHSKRRDLIIAGIFIGLAGITKQEFAFAGAATVTLSLVYRHRMAMRRLTADLVSAAIPAMALAAPVFATLFAFIEWRILIEDCHLFLTHLTDSLITFNGFRSGLDYPLDSLVQMTGAAAVSTALVASITLAGDREGVIRKRMAWLLALSAAVTVVVLAVAIDRWDGSPLRALPLFLFGIILVSWRARSRADSPMETGAGDSRAFAFVLAVYSLAILLRVILRVPSGGFGGNALLPASLILTSWGLLQALPAAIQRWTGDPSSSRRAGRFSQTLLVITVIAMMITFSLRYRTRYSYEIEARHGTLIVEEDQGATIDLTLDFIERSTDEGEVIAVLPEGNDLAFLTGRGINLRHQILIPDFMSVQDERDAISALEQDQVRFVFIVNRPMAEFGASAFGRDFYQTLGNWIEDNYDLVEVLGGTLNPEPEIGEGGFFVKIYQRRTS